MILSPTFVIAIEAKYTEPAYETVKDWLGNPLRSNRIAVLDGWIKLIEKGTGVRLSAAELSIYPYQLVHRTASACFSPPAQRWVVYQLFSDIKISYYQEHLSAIYHLAYGQTNLSFGLLFSPPEVSAEYVRLKNLWASGQRDLSDPVRSGLLSDSLFKFSGVQFIGVNSQNGRPMTHGRASALSRVTTPPGSSLFGLKKENRGMGLPPPRFICRPRTKSRNLALIQWLFRSGPLKSPTEAT